MNKKKANTKRVHTASRTTLLKQYSQQGRWKEAERLAHRVLADDRENSQALKILIEVALIAENHAVALPLCERLVRVVPDDVWAVMNYGVCLAGVRRFEEAGDQLRYAETLAPDDPDVCGNLSSFYFAAQDFERSLAYADKAIAGAPGNPSAHNSRGATLLKLDRYEEALPSLAKAIELYPGDYYEEAVENLGLTLHDMKRYADAYACYEEILRIDPCNTGALALLVHSALQLCQWDKWGGRISSLLQAVRGDHMPPGMPPFVYLSLPGAKGADHLVTARYAAELLLSVPAALRPPASDLPAMLPERSRIRIGYLSSDLHQHATSQLIAEVIEHHDRERFEVFAYSYGPDDNSPMRARLQVAFEHFVELRDTPLKAAVERICDDQVDILVDLKGWTHGARLEISAMRPAPIIVSWLGYPGTLGNSGMADYIIGDPYVTPLEHAGDYSELIIQLPHSYQPNDRRREVGSTPSRADLGLPDHAVVYCSFNQTYKINKEVFAAWCEILRQVPDSVLWLLEPDEVTAENLRREIQEHGVSQERLVFSRRCPLPEHLGRLQQASLALDTAPYGSHTTGSDALWVGVPVVTCPGETFASRVAASLVAAAGVPELITGSWGDYVALAVRLGKDREALSAIREKLKSARDTCPLFDSARFARNLEKAYQRIIEDARGGKREAIVLREE